MQRNLPANMFFCVYDKIRSLISETQLGTDLPSHLILGLGQRWPPLIHPRSVTGPSGKSRLFFHTHSIFAPLLLVQCTAVQCILVNKVHLRGVRGGPQWHSYLGLQRFVKGCYQSSQRLSIGSKRLFAGPGGYYKVSKELPSSNQKRALCPPTHPPQCASGPISPPILAKKNLWKLVHP